MNGFYEAQNEYERRMECPYDVGGALYDEDDEDDSAYESYVDWQIEQYKLGEY